MHEGTYSTAQRFSSLKDAHVTFVLLLGSMRQHGGGAGQVSCRPEAQARLYCKTVSTGGDAKCPVAEFPCQACVLSRVEGFLGWQTRQTTTAQSSCRFCASASLCSSGRRPHGSTIPGQSVGVGG